MKMQVELKVKYTFHADDDVAAVMLFNDQLEGIHSVLHNASGAKVSDATFEYSLGRAKPADAPGCVR